ncbi:MULTISPECIES: NADPH-dependent FMN reductase [Streptomyces]|uniref:NADPH-dependent FMN reductase n=1 Tax=Streptomyces TaxID=1883 RepID=UPI0019623539|nr:MULTISPECIES: NADPH-dependent FMN reductase [Streptomyces]QRX96314.1 NADPH-dependent FMN reductase [Streptomyces noursei]UJB44935.1 NADPH-dependent FMN reductase [Streptomyces sp. A1-5]
MTSLLAVSGSPSADSRTALLAGHLVRRLSLVGLPTTHLRVRDLPAAELLAGRTEHPALRRSLDAVEAASGIVVATPVYNAAYSGLLKAFLDLLPRTGLAGKAVLPLMTGGSSAHALAIDYALRPVLCALGARQVVRGAFVLDRTIEPGPDGALRIHPDTAPRLDRALDEFLVALTDGVTVSALTGS